MDSCGYLKCYAGDFSYELTSHRVIWKTSRKGFVLRYTRGAFFWVYIGQFKWGGFTTINLNVMGWVETSSVALIQKDAETRWQCYWPLSSASIHGFFRVGGQIPQVRRQVPVQVTWILMRDLEIIVSNTLIRSFRWSGPPRAPLAKLSHVFFKHDPAPIHSPPRSETWFCSLCAFSATSNIT